MASTTTFPRSIAHEVRDHCLCFAAQRAARELARRFDRAFADLGITNGQFSMMVAMGGMGQPKLGDIARFMGMDHATVTAAVRKLEKRGLVAIVEDGKDRRARRVSLTADGIVTVQRAMLVWRVEHLKMTLEHGEESVPALRDQLMQFGPPLRRAPEAA
ncbi:MAG TPA: MarR family transcriptional regulator [Bauldia sp.]|nr:MarR family transcriptional regulator [Bauldia sp.]